MSERGSISSQYFYCRACCDAARKVFEDNYKYVTAVEVPSSMSATDMGYPIIIAAKTHSGYPSEDIDEFENSVAPALAAVLCHPARFAIIPDDERGGGIFVVTPEAIKVDPILKALS